MVPSYFRSYRIKIYNHLCSQLAPSILLIQPVKILQQLPGHLVFFFFFFLVNLFIYLFVDVLGLSFCARAFSSCGERGHSSSRCAGLSLSRPLLLRSTSSRRAGSVVVAHGPSRSAACGIFPDRGTNPCPLHWQVDF